MCLSDIRHPGYRHPSDQRGSCDIIPYFIFTLDNQHYTYNNKIKLNETGFEGGVSVAIDLFTLQ